MRRAASLWPTFILLNVGNTMRVSFQIATDFTSTAYPIMGISGFIEVVGLTLWAYELLSNMRVGRALEKQTAETFTQPPLLTIAPQTRVADVLRSYPQSFDVFLKHGFTPLSNPVLRRTMARVVTVEQACRREGVNLERSWKNFNRFPALTDSQFESQEINQINPARSARRIASRRLCAPSFRSMCCT